MKGKLLGVFILSAFLSCFYVACELDEQRPKIPITCTKG